jgi:hypothetical protein
MAGVTQVPFSRYHQRIIATAIFNAKPKTNDRDRMDDWVKMCSEIGSAIRELGGQFDMSNWLDLCFYGPK